MACEKIKGSRKNSESSAERSIDSTLKIYSQRSTGSVPLPVITSVDLQHVLCTHSTPGTSLEVAGAQRGALVQDFTDLKNPWQCRQEELNSAPRAPLLCVYQGPLSTTHKSSEKYRFCLRVTAQFPPSQKLNQWGVGITADFLPAPGKNIWKLPLTCPKSSCKGVSTNPWHLDVSRGK